MIDILQLLDYSSPSKINKDHQGTVGQKDF